MSETDAKQRGNLRRQHSLLVKLADFSYLATCQFGCANFRPFDMAVFCHLVSIVVSISTKEQMVYFYARWAIAAMANHQSVRDRAISQLPGNSMRSMGLVPAAKGSVTSRILKAQPQPTITGFIYPVPKPLSSADRNAACTIASHTTSATSVSQTLSSIFPLVSFLTKLAKIALGRIKFFYHVICNHYNWLPIPGCNCQENTAGSSSILQHLIPTEKYC